MKITFDAVESLERSVLESALKGHELIFLDRALSRDEVVGDTDILSIFVSSPVSAPTIATIPSLKCITARSTGYDHIDSVATKERGIVISTVPSYGSRTVAEFAFALILALSRKAYAAFDELRDKGTTDFKRYEGFDLAGKTIGIIGTGKIGKNAARIARGFDMRVLLSDKHPDEVFAKEIEATYRELENVVAESDIISLHVPYMKETHHLMNAELLQKCKQGSYIVNTARGAVIDTLALAQALKRGHIAGAGLDVLEGEKELLDEMSLLSDVHNDIHEFRTLVAAHALVDMPNVIVTPHIAFNTREAKREIIETTIQNILAFVQGTPINTVRT
jgi:D-lactate dehydrogenase